MQPESDPAGNLSSVLKKNLLLFLASGLLMLAGLEAAIRAFDLFPEARMRGECPPPEVRERRRAEEKSAEPAPLFGMVAHPYTGWVGRTGAEVLRCQRRASIFGDREPTPWFLENSRVNQFGFNSSIDDYRVVREKDFVVVLTGGSVANDLAVLGGDALVRSLVARRPDLAGRVRLLNFGSAAYKQPQHLFALAQALLLEIPVDAVINLDGFNEVTLGASAAYEGIHPLFPPEANFGARLRLARGALTKDEIRLTVEMGEVGDRLNRLVAFSERHPWLWHLESARAIVGTLTLREDESLRKVRGRIRALSRETSGPATANLPDPCLGEPLGCLDTIALLWRNASLAMNLLSRRAGAEYMQVLQPNQYVEGSKPLNAEELEIAWDPRSHWAQAAIGYPRLLAEVPALRAEGVVFADLTGIFRSHDETIYRDSCCHYNWHGNQILGEAVGELVADHVK